MVCLNDYTLSALKKAKILIFREHYILTESVIFILILRWTVLLESFVCVWYAKSAVAVVVIIPL